MTDTELNVSLGSRNSDLVRRRHACWYMGFLAEFDIREGSNTQVITVLFQR
jgi:hypothetical protein